MAIETIPANDRVERFVAAGGETVFPFDFPIYDATDLLVQRVRAGTVTTLARGTDYALAGAGEQGGGTVTLTTAALAGDVIALSSAQPIGRNVVLREGGDLRAQALNDEFNRIIIAMQQVASARDRALRVPSEDAPPPVLPAASVRANRVLGFDAQGQPVAAVAALGPAAVSTFGESLVSAATAAAARGLLAAPSLRELQDGALLWGGVAGGTATALTVAIVPAPPVLPEGMRLGFRVGAATNTGPATLNVSGLGASAIQTARGLALTGGELLPGIIVEVQRVAGAWRLLNPFLVRDRQIAVGVANVPFLLPPGGSAVRLTWSDVRLAADNTALCFQASVDNGASWLTGVNDYVNTNTRPDASGAQTQITNNNIVGILTTGLDNQLSSAVCVGSAVLSRGGGGRAGVCIASAAGISDNTPNAIVPWASAVYCQGAVLSSPINAVRFLAPTGAISGTFSVEPIL